jgi:hypothetical protein
MLEAQAIITSKEDSGARLHNMQAVTIPPKATMIIGIEVRRELTTG